MADKFDQFLGELTFEIRYDYGYTYLDRCGQTLIDIERAKPEWVAGDINPQGGSLQNPGKKYTAFFDVKRFLIAAIRPDAKGFAEEARSIWSIVRDNLGLTDFIRVGARFVYYLPTLTKEDAEKKLAKASYNITYPNEFDEKGYKPKFREMILTLERREVEYRLDLKGVTRTEHPVPASTLVVTDPRLLAQRQREARLEALKQRHAYEKNPEHGISFDVDCAKFEPAQVKPNEFILESETTIKADFLKLLTSLR